MQVRPCGRVLDPDRVEERREERRVVQQRVHPGQLRGHPQHLRRQHRLPQRRLIAYRTEHDGLDPFQHKGLRPSSGSDRAEQWINMPTSSGRSNLDDVGQPFWFVKDHDRRCSTPSSRPPGTRILMMPVPVPRAKIAKRLIGRLRRPLVCGAGGQSTPIWHATLAFRQHRQRRPKIALFDPSLKYRHSQPPVGSPSVLGRGQSGAAGELLVERSDEIHPVNARPSEAGCANVTSTALAGWRDAG